MATSTLPLISAGAAVSTVVLAGIDPASQATWNGHNGIQLGAAFQLDLRITGTQATIPVWSAIDNPLQITVDGVVTTPALSGLSAWVDLTLFTGLSDAAHVVRIKYAQACWIDSASGITVTGAAPSFSLPTTMAFAHLLRASYIRADFPWAPVTKDGVPCVVCQENDATFDFQATDITSIQLYGKINGRGGFVIQIDGVEQTLKANPNPGAASPWGWFSLAGSLPSGTHNYRVSMPFLQTSQDIWISNVAVLGGTVATSPLTPRTRSLWYNGDSITGVQGIPTSGGYSIVGNPHQTGLAIPPLAIGAHGTSGSRTPAVSQLRVGAPRPTDIVLQWGANDCWLTVPTNPTTFQANYQALLTALRLDAPQAHIWVMGLLPIGNGKDWPGYNLRIQAAVTAVGDLNTSYVPRDDWINIDTTDLNTDLLHPTPVGYLKISAREQAQFFASGLVVSGGSTGGLAAVPSLPFTVSIAGGAVFTGVETLTLTGSDGVLEVAAAGGIVAGEGTGEVTVTPEAGASSFTFTYAPNSLGSHTISFANNQGWPDPTDVTYEATPPSRSLMLTPYFSLGGAPDAPTVAGGAVIGAPYTFAGDGLPPAATGAVIWTTSPYADVSTTPGTGTLSSLSFSVVGRAGGNTTIITTGTGGTAPTMRLTGGKGGSAPGALTASTGGAGGAVQSFGGAGGDALVIGTGANVAGTGGGFTGRAGAGGTASGGATNQGGAGGVGLLQGGAGGIGDTPGAGGVASVLGGTAAAMAGASPGAVTVAGGVASTTGSGGPGAGVTVSASAAGGDNTVNRAGGTLALNAGAAKGSSTGGVITRTAGAGGVGTGTAGAAGGAITDTAGPGGVGSLTGGTGGAYILRGGLGGNSATPGAGGPLTFQTAATITHTTRMQITALGSVVIGSGSLLATTDTDGDLYIPGCAGTPTGVPTAKTGSFALRWDTTNKKLYVYDASWVAMN